MLKRPISQQLRFHDLIIAPSFPRIRRSCIQPHPRTDHNNPALCVLHVSQSEKASVAVVSPGQPMRGEAGEAGEAGDAVINQGGERLDVASSLEAERAGSSPNERHTGTKETGTAWPPTLPHTLSPILPPILPPVSYPVSYPASCLLSCLLF